MSSKKKHAKASRSLPEKLIQDWLEEWFSKKGYSVKREVITPVGRIDLIIYRNSPERAYNGVRANEKILIEVKEAKSIKHAIGQLESYEKYHSDCTQLWCIYFDRYGNKKNIDSSYQNHRSGLSGKRIKLNDVMEIVSKEELYHFGEDKGYFQIAEVNTNVGEDKGLWLSEETTNIQMERDSSVTMIITPTIEKEMMETTYYF